MGRALPLPDSAAPLITKLATGAANYFLLLLKGSRESTVVGFEERAAR